MTVCPHPSRRAVLAVSCLFASMASAQSVTEERVLVRGTRLEAMPSSARVVTGARLDARRAASSDTAALLRDVPGLNLRAAGGVSSLPALHGLADDRLRLIVDGVDEYRKNKPPFRVLAAGSLA